jgi:release factor glutamine methyltransferase
VATPNDLEALAALLSGAGFVAARDEAGELLACAAGDVEFLDSLVGRRLAGEPLAWITGSISFCGVELHVDPGVYVPRWQSEPLARRAVERLPPNGAAIDLCTGSGAIAKTLITNRSGARVVASDVDERAVACATANGVGAYCGDLFAPLPRTLEERVDVVVGVVPYLPSRELAPASSSTSRTAAGRRLSSTAGSRSAAWASPSRSPSSCCGGARAHAATAGSKASARPRRSCARR